MQYIKIHSQDNVAVALTDIAAGSVVTIDNDSVTLGQDIVRGHKFALRAIAKGENVVKYGLPIGHALADIAPGEHVHQHSHHAAKYGSSPERRGGAGGWPWL